MMIIVVMHWLVIAVMIGLILATVTCCNLLLATAAINDVNTAMVEWPKQFTQTDKYFIAMMVINCDLIW